MLDSTTPGRLDAVDDRAAPRPLDDRPTIRPVDDDPAVRALDDLVAAIRSTQRLLDEAVVRAEALLARRREGASYREIVPAEPRPLVVEMVSESVLRLVEAGSRFRRAQARALHDEGMTMEAIAALFGVTRQRISNLLKSSRAITERERFVAS